MPMSLCKDKLAISVCCCSRLFGEGVAALVGREFPDVEVEAHICESHCALFEHDPDLLILDFSILSTPSFDDLIEKRVPALLLGTSCLPIIENAQLASLVRKGLAGIVSPPAAREEFGRAVRSVLAGEMWFSRRKMQDLIAAAGGEVEENGGPALTPREREVLKLLCRGYRNKEIMASLGVSEQAVKSHLNRVMKKFNVSDRLQLALQAVRRWPRYLHQS